MNKQSIGILLNRVGLSICIGMIVLLVACQESVSSSGSNNDNTVTPANIALGGANIAVPGDTTGILKFTKGDSIVKEKHTTHIQVTLKKDGNIVDGYNKRLFADDTEIKPLAPGTYTAELRSYSSDTSKASSEAKIVNGLTVADGSAAPTTAVTVASEEKHAAKFVVTVDALDESNDDKKAAIFGKHYDASPLSDAMFVLYYVRQGYTKNSVTVNETTDAANILQAVGDGTHKKEDAGKVDINSKAGLKAIEVLGLKKQATYRYFIRTINKIDITKHVDGAARTVTLPSSPVVQDPVVTAVLDKNTIKVRVPETIVFGSNAEGADLERATVRYFFYYVKNGYTDVGAPVNDDTTADEIMGFDYSGSANPERGKIALTVDNGVGADKTVDKEVEALLANTQYYYFVRVEETANANNGTNSAVNNVTTESGAAPVDSVPTPTVTGTATGFTTGDIVAAVVTTAKKADGSPAEASDVEYVLYYASSSTALTGVQTKAEATKSSDTAGVEAATVGGPVIVAGKTFTVGTTVYIVVEARIKSDSIKTTLSLIASYFVQVPPTVAFGETAKLYKKDDKIQVTVEYASAVTVEKTPKITIKIGTEDKEALYVQGSNSNNLIFEYTVTAVDEDANGIEIKENALALNGGTIKHNDAENTDAIITHSAVEPDANRKVGAPKAPTGTNLKMRIDGANTGNITVVVEELTNDGAGTDKDKFGTRAGGTAVQASDVEYWVYYGKITDRVLAKEKILLGIAEEGSVAVLSLSGVPNGGSQAVDSENFGIVKVQAGKGSKHTFTGLISDVEYYFFLRQVHPDGNSKDASKGDSGDLEKDSVVHTIPKGPTTAVVPVLRMPKDATVSGTIKVMVDITVGDADGTDAEKYGIKSDGTPVTLAEVEYWLYYSKDTSFDSMQKIVTEAERLENAISTETVNGKKVPLPVGQTSYSVDQEVTGVILISGDAGSYKFSGLTFSTTYCFVLRQVHPQGGKDPTKSKSGVFSITSDLATGDTAGGTTK